MFETVVIISFGEGFSSIFDDEVFMELFIRKL